MSDQTEPSTETEKLKKGWLKRQLDSMTKKEVSNAAQIANAYGSRGLVPSSTNDYWNSLTAWPGATTSEPDVWGRMQEQQAELDQQAKAVKLFTQMLEQQRQQVAAAQRRMSKREMMAGALKEMTAIRERLDQLTAIITTEALTGDDEPEAEAPSTVSTWTTWTRHPLAGQLTTVSSINQLIDAKLGLK